MLSLINKSLRRKTRNSGKIMRRKVLLPRLSVFRSNSHIYAQIIDDVKRCTLVAASSLEKSVIPDSSQLKGIEIANLVGKKVAERAIAQGMKKIVFDRGKFLFHGKVKALASAAREQGLEF